MKRFSLVLFFLIVIEISLGGGGRLMAIGPVSLRMVLFGLALLTSFFSFLTGKEKLPLDYKRLLIFFSLLSAISVTLGIFSGANPSLVWEDLKPLLYFLILPFFYFTLTEIKTLEQTSLILKTSGILLALAFFALLLFIHLHLVPFLKVYSKLMPTGEFFFRGEMTFTYKGFLFLCISLLFFHFTEGKYKLLFMMLLIIAVLLTVTRGFWLALLGTYSIYYFIKEGMFVRVKPVLLALLAIGVIVLGQMLIAKTSESIATIRSADSAPSKNDTPSTKLLGDRAYSDEGRFQQIKEVMAEVTPLSVFFGHGFGTGIPVRPVHMEISYLEIFHKQGIFGLAFWGYVFWLLFRKYRSAPPGGLCDAFFFSAVFVFLQSLTNQYMNNPIGLSMILLSMVSLGVLLKSNNKDISGNSFVI